MLQSYKGYDGISDTIVFEIDCINKCNFNCPYCEMQNNSWNPTNDKKDWGKKQNIFNSIPFFEKFPYKYRIHLLGGEPTLYPNLEIFIKSLPNADIKLFTNGSLLNRLKCISSITNPPSITISIHPNEYKMEYLEEFIKENLHIKFKNVKFLAILYNLEDNISFFEKIFDILIVNDIQLDMYLPFDENGKYKLNKNDLKLVKYLQQKYMKPNIKLDNTLVSHIDIYEKRQVLSQNKLCYKNLWLIDHKGEFYKDGTDIKFNLDDIYSKKINMDIFNFKAINCNKECYCPANNYYTKIRK